MPKHFISNSTENIQEPLGPNPSYDDVLDLAVEYTFPCSDPIAVSCCSDAETKPRAKPDEKSGRSQQASTDHPSASRDARDDIRKNCRKVIQTTERALNQRPKA